MAPLPYEKFMDHPARDREEKLVATYHSNPALLSRGMFSTIDALAHAAPQLRAQLVSLDPGEYTDEEGKVTPPNISVAALADALDRYEDGDLAVTA